MPSVVPLSEFNRNQTEVIEQLHESGEPIYLTRNGRATVVVMDAEAFDRAQAMRDELREREMETYFGMLRGFHDYVDGNLMSLEEADARIRTKMGWS